MASTDGWARLLAPEAPWLQSAAAVLGPLKSSLVHFSPSSISFFRKVDAAAEAVLSFYAPELPPGARQNSGLPMMDGKDMALVIGLYLLLVGLSLLAFRGSASHAVLQRKEKSLLEKIGPVFVCQAVYNAAQVLLCSFLVLRVFDVWHTENYSFVCNRFNVPNTRMAEVTWFFYMLKYLDLLDTVFMIVRGNWRQVSFLHVYHHSSVIYISWVNASVGFDGEIYYVVALNGLVHVVMYAYYLLASLNCGVARLVKQFVTQLQMLQFLSMSLHAAYHVYFHQSCKYPFRVTVGYFFYVLSLFLLFHNFSKKTYGRSSSSSSSSSSGGGRGKVKAL
ncbi:elongation of very long chain fatty acids 4 protein, putative [Eimeria tenella]|uniref:Elongation of fatty acids protein n=1 Tax=Eimeria tenella TaxID=5802 RepID=U6KZF3_EIMTE|nr:elongation of very long chain fatty acids 4 protein, putative [Eimeria tenella]CDJ43346.1 elongation of very long chain fatty acids 4 protein, putative [Eimeria tenella]|eukprot:XP_013234096.1 elongation of very long chain fatty acids 4 protein, putative [Eimeria tenella]